VSDKPLTVSDLLVARKAFAEDVNRRAEEFIRQSTAAYIAWYFEALRKGGEFWFHWYYWHGNGD
jgi:hypothetical protein